MQVFSQGTGSPGAIHGLENFGTFARYRRRIDKSQINPLLKRIVNEEFNSKSQYTNSFSLPKNISQQSEILNKTRHQSMDSRASNALNLSDSRDYSTNLSLQVSPVNYGFGRGMRNLEYGKMFLDNTSIASKDWKPGSLLKTSSELKVCYLDGVNSLSTESNSNRNMMPSIAIQKTPQPNSLKISQDVQNNILYTPKRNHANFNLKPISNIKHITPTESLDELERQVRDQANQK